MNVQYQLVPNWLINVNYKLTGARTDLFYNGAIFDNEEVDLKSFHLLDVYTEYAILKGKLKLFLDAKNLMNQNYYEAYGYTALPANVQAGLSARF